LAAEAREPGAIDYLIKPIAPDDLEKLIQQTLLKCESEEQGRNQTYSGDAGPSLWPLYFLLSTPAKSIL
jgi:DNA-binding NtrC family response regulator